MAEYAAVSVTDYYGPETRYSIISVHDTADDAQAAAQQHAPDYDPKVRAHRLSHNQSSPTRGEVWEIVGDFEPSDMDEDDCAERGYIIAVDEDSNRVCMLKPVELAQGD